MPTRVPSNAPKEQCVKSIRKIVAAEHDKGSVQSYRARLSISEKFESPDVFNHCIVRLNKNDVIVRQNSQNFKQCKDQLEGSAREISTPFRDNTTGAHNKISTY